MKRLNNKGFTIAEVLVSFSLITVILSSIVATTIHYRDKLKQEEVITQLTDFKNSVTKAIYDDIVSGKIARVERCIGTANCVNFVDVNGKAHTLRIEDVKETNSISRRGAYLYYDEIKYMLPDSDLGAGIDRVCDFMGGIEVNEYNEYNNRIFKVKLIYKHRDMDLQQELLFIVA